MYVLYSERDVIKIGSLQIIGWLIYDKDLLPSYIEVFFCWESVGPLSNYTQRATGIRTYK
jgi:hypothetical protein